MNRTGCAILFLFCSHFACFSQSAPAVDEIIPSLMTYRTNGGISWGEDDFCQVFYCVIPASQTHPAYIRVYDPHTGGSLDEAKGVSGDDGIFRIFSVAKNGVLCNTSEENNWVARLFPIAEEEKNSTVEIPLVKNQSAQIRNNFVVIAVRNQYGISLPFSVYPIGGIPVYTPKIKMKQ